MGIVRQQLKAPERKRLETEIELLRTQVEFRRAGAVKGAWLDLADSFLEKAEQQQQSGDLDSAWKFLHAAARELVFSLSPTEVAGQAAALKLEAEQKLGGWRSLAVLSHLKQLQDQDLPIDQQRSLAAAMLIRDEQANNVYFKMRLLRRQMFTLSCALALLLAVFVALLLFGTDPSQALATDPRQDHWFALVSCMILGGIGACLSALISFASATPELSIPIRLTNVSVTLTRPTIGFASGLAAILLVRAGLIATPKIEAAWIIALAFGFSERLVIGALEKVASR